MGFCKKVSDTFVKLKNMVCQSIKGYGFCILLIEAVYMICHDNFFISGIRPLYANFLGTDVKEAASLDFHIIFGPLYFRSYPIYF
jgi:hypothetical protein